MTDLFTAEQTKFILHELGVQVVSETDTHYLVLCPFHGNLNSPAMVVDKEKGVYLCNNAACDARGPLRSMVRTLLDYNEFQVEVLLMKSKDAANVDLPERIRRRKEAVEMPDYPMARVEKAEADFWQNKEAIEYMTKQRHFTEETLREFRVGYIPSHHLIAVHMFDVNGRPVGFVGRSVDGKRFKNSKRLPKRHTLFNIHNAKREPHTFITEASFDAMRGWQATGIHGVALLGSSLSDYHEDQLTTYFDHVTLATDDDKEKTVKSRCARCKRHGFNQCRGHNTGRELGRDIASRLRGMRVDWAWANSLQQYDGGKDFGDMTDEQIKYAVDQAISNYEVTRRVA